MLLSINPEHVDNILKGKKKYEFRKVRCREDINKIVIYSTSPIMKIVGEVEVLCILEFDPETLWNMTSTKSGITKEFYDRYYDGKDKAIAFKLGKVKKYRKPFELSDFGLKFAPQSFLYLPKCKMSMDEHLIL